ncbi:hypothetical protein A1O3_01174 [Capronia epimyces CBS 606.96]|uniref:FAD-binding domain-containing protein n=1 Tax=Capronia epimyces CBS 606.96 TaxID=1182542 RepID=W9YI97_9EURO|nr:uncharacterized protein A1O3_01174 [Capronia epimyces CBS 606.96]EXJ92622.1 hypothetical protein A1O3_01174 [Capronia epimyces CBS 606.96]
MISPQTLKVAIVGGGPGGLAAAIALSELPYVSVTLYEKNPEPREAGAGISLSTNAWRILDLLGAADGVKGGSKANTQQRNGYNGNILKVIKNPEHSDKDRRGAIRARRTRLQSALLARVPQGVIQFSKKLKVLENLEAGGVRLVFDDQTEAIADLVVGADGMHSAVRRTIFPDHQLRFNGMTAWRVIVPLSSIAHLTDITQATAWWWGDGGHVYFSPVDDESETDDPLFEITLRSYHEPEIPGQTVIWGVPATNEKVASRYTKYDPRVRAAIASVPEGQWREFAMFAGPRLENIIAWDKVALVGDASHPLTGAFGSGATFAMEDGWILARAIEHVRASPTRVKDALEIFAEIREPFYTRAFDWLDKRGAETKQLQADNKDLDFESAVRGRLDRFFGSENELNWIYKNDIAQVWKNYLEKKPELYLP